MRFRRPSLGDERRRAGAQAVARALFNWDVVYLQACVRVRRMDDERAREYFDVLFDQSNGFSSVRMEPHMAEKARPLWPNLARDTEAYIAARPELSALCVQLLRENAEMKAPLYTRFRDYVWGQLTGAQSVHLENLLTAIVQLGWRKPLREVFVGLDDRYLEHEYYNAWQHRLAPRPWHEPVIKGLHKCAREFRERIAPYANTLGKLEGDPPWLAPTFLTRDAFVVGRPIEKRWARAALGLDRRASDDTLPYMSSEYVGPAVVRSVMMGDW